MEPLNEPQQKVYDSIVRHWRDWGYAPTVRAIQKDIGAKSPSGVHEHLKSLQEKGWIHRTPGKAGSITVVEQ